MNWQHIDTVPKDGTRVLVCFDECEIVAARYCDGWWDQDENNAWNHYYARWWMPLPPPPAAMDTPKGGGDA